MELVPSDVELQGLYVLYNMEVFVFPP